MIEIIGITVLILSGLCVPAILFLNKKRKTRNNSFQTRESCNLIVAEIKRDISEIKISVGQTQQKFESVDRNLAELTGYIRGKIDGS